MNFLRIALCDLRRMLSDRYLIFFWLVMPLGFAYMFGILFGNLGGNQNTWMPVVNLDGHELSWIFVEQMRGEGYGVDVRAATDELHVRDLPRTVIIPAAFSANILAGTNANLIFTAGRGGGTEQNMDAQARLIHTIAKFTGAAADVDLIDSGWNDESREKFKQSLAGAPRLTVEKQSHASLRPPPKGLSLSLPQFLVMFSLMNSVMYGGISLLLERQSKQLSRLVAAPVSTMEIFMGKLIGRILQPILQAAVLLICGYFLMGVSLGDHPLALIPVMLALSICCGSLSLLFGILSSTELQITGLGMLATMVLSALGGCWWPLEVVPPIAKTAAQFTPTYWALRGLQDVMSFGKSWSGVAQECLILLGYAAVFLAMAIPAFRKRQA